MTGMPAATVFTGLTYLCPIGLWCNPSDDRRSRNWRKKWIRDRIAPVAARPAIGRELLAELRTVRLRHATASRNAARAGAGATRNHDARVDVPFV